MKANPVGWFEIYVTDMGRARKFYETVMAGTLQKLDASDIDMWAFPMEPEGYGSAGALIRMPGCEPGGNSTIVYFSSEDCAVEESRVASAGGRVLKSKFSIGPYGFVTLVHDTEGNLIGLHSRK